MTGRTRAHKLHRRFELVVALLSVVGVTLVLSSADSASAAAGDEAPGFSNEAAIDPAPATGESTEPAPETSTDPEETSAEPDGGQTYGSQRDRKSSAARISDAKANPSRIFLGSRRRAAFHFELAGDRTRKLLVKVVKVKTGKVKRRFRLGQVVPGERQRVAWDGKLGGKGGFSSQGEHAFRVFSGGERAAVSRNSSSQRFDFYTHRFPLLGRHSYGQGFGAGRGHQGQDVLTGCGTRVVAARGGRVQAKAYQSAAGYYVVIDGRGTGQDYAYMHLGRRSRPNEGSWVRTGQRIGSARSTGNATACMIHFELWTKPGWYQGGHAKSPTRALKRWDGWS